MSTIKAFSWNIEKFKGGSTRLAKLAEIIKEKEPDIFGLFEIVNVDLIKLMEVHFPEYSFHMTQGPQIQEILVGYKRRSFDLAIFSQKREFKAFNPSLRPGGLLSVKKGGTFYNFLFLHTDSGTGAADFGNRAEMFEKIFSLKSKLDKKARNRNANLIVMSDANTMGMSYPTRAKRDLKVSSELEIKALSTAARRKKMSLLLKEHDITFNNGYLKSDLDQVIASDSVDVKTLGTRTDGRPYKVAVFGWNQLNGAQRKYYIENISDHSTLYIEIEV